MTALLRPHFEPAVDNAPTPFMVSMTKHAAETVVIVRGELDLATVPRLQATLDGLGSSECCHTILDCSGLTFCDSTGLSTLVRAHQHHQAHGARLTLTASPPVLQRLLALTGLDEYLDSAATTVPTGPATP